MWTQLAKSETRKKLFSEQLTDTPKGTNRTAGGNYFAWSQEYQQEAVVP